MFDQNNFGILRAKGASTSFVQQCASAIKTPFMLHCFLCYKLISHFVLLFQTLGINNSNLEWHLIMISSESFLKMYEFHVNYSISHLTLFWLKNSFFALVKFLWKLFCLETFKSGKKSLLWENQGVDLLNDWCSYSLDRFSVQETVLRVGARQLPTSSWLTKFKPFCSRFDYQLQSRKKEINTLWAIN